MRRTGLRLLEALASPHPVDRYLTLLHPMLSVREARAELTAVHRTTPDTVTLTLRPNRHWGGSTPGQYVRVSVEVDGVRLTRCYSPARTHPDGSFDLIVKAQGRVSRWLHRDARPGLVLPLSPAEGTFTLPDRRPDRVLLVSGGSGITPVLAMLRALIAEDHPGEITFLHYADRPEDVPHLPELRALARPGVQMVFAHTASDAGDLTGLFGQEHLDAVAPWYADADTFLCGPPGLMAAVTRFYAERGLSDRLSTEDFAPAATPAAPGASGGTVTFARSGVTVDNNGDALLVQAEAAGLRPEHGCRMGICFSCTSVKTAGRVRDARSGAETTDPDEEIQLCVSVPVGDVTIEI